MTLLRARITSHPALLVLVLTLLGATTAAAGVVFEATTTHHDAKGEWTEATTWTVDGTNFKFESTPSKGKKPVKNEAYFRGDRRELVQVDHATQTYMSIDTESISAMGAEIDEAMKEAMSEVEAHLEELDPEQRKMVEQMLKGQMGTVEDGDAPEAPQYEFLLTEERAEINGFPTTRYDVMFDGERTGELWITDWDNVEGGKEARSSINKLASFFNELRTSISWASDLTNNHPLANFAQSEGFPVLSRTFENDKLISETKLESAQAKDLDAGTFNPPAGYRQRTMGPE